ncbi:DNA methyltransferase [uncultured Chloroflexus sp.]|uniref:Eco57I restriction-modification methylase domain-containing protein n=2 Tax=uncultured Chloroflexus sp. TaxID=214040 RepID=UPI002624CA6F|nr:DNA methyltransferase [uncultured Chloroflexus sp.]
MEHCLTSERIAAHFYTELQPSYVSLHARIQGIACEHERRWYATVLLSRLIVLWFIQTQGWLDRNPAYLPEQLAWSRTHFGPDRYYRDVLRALWFDGLGRVRDERDAATNRLLGDVPYLGSNLFVPHPLEVQHGDTITIPDSVFEQLFTFFSQWCWYVHGRPGRHEREIDPEIVGYALEQAINQKELGAYYTHDDVSAYICRATIIPALFDKAGLSLAPLALAQNIRRYIYPAMQQAVPLPTETDREQAARHSQVAAIVAAATSGQLVTINDAITANLDLTALMADLISQLDPHRLLALFTALVGDPHGGYPPLSVLDPTVGSGAFLLAALRVLTPIYHAVLGRIATIQPDWLASHEIGADAHRSDQIIKWIVAHNLYGVDLMPEAIEVCKLRLLLVLIAEYANVGLRTPLPNLDHTIRLGNALVGEGNGSIEAHPSPAQYHHTQTFNWHEAFPTILANGGFDVIVGNPPYLPYRNVKHNYRMVEYQTAGSGNLYAFVIERALQLLKPHGRFGMIVPIASVSTERMRPLQQLYRSYTQWHSHYAVRPGKLFAGVDMNLTITLLHQSDGEARVYSTTYHRWFNRPPSDRPFLFAKLSYCRWDGITTHANPLPKIGSPIEIAILTTMHQHRKKLKDFIVEHGTPIYYHSGGRYWRKALPEKLSSHYKPITVPVHLRPIVFALLNSQLFYWYWIVNSNCMDVVAREVLELPVFDLNLVDVEPYCTLERELLAVYAAHRCHRIRRGERINTGEINFDAKPAKPILDRIDRQLGRDYGFNAEAVDFILNYDIKYRMGRTID